MAGTRARGDIGRATAERPARKSMHAIQSGLVLTVSLIAAVVMAACGASTPPPSGPESLPPASPSVLPGAPTPSPLSTPGDPPTAAPSERTPDPPATPAPTRAATPRPTERPTEPTFTRAERYLLDGITRGEGDCAPVRRAALPGLAVAGIDCDLIGSPVARAGYYLFKTDADMLDAYMARMSVEGIVIDSGACAPGEGESAYIPYAEDETAPDRHACFVNDKGYGNYRATLSGYHVYIGLLGRNRDMQTLQDWAWLGDEDTPGYPTLWRQASAYRP